MSNQVERPDDAPDKDHPLLVAARYNDAEAEDHGLREMVEKHGLDFHALEWTAEQRALRVVLLQNGQVMESGNECHTIELSDQQRALLDALVPLYLDAILIGWRAKTIDDATEEDTA